MITSGRNARSAGLLSAGTPGWRTNWNNSSWWRKMRLAKRAARMLGQGILLAQGTGAREEIVILLLARGIRRGRVLLQPRFAFVVERPHALRPRQHFLRLRVGFLQGMQVTQQMYPTALMRSADHIVPAVEVADQMALEVQPQNPLGNRLARLW